MLNIVFVARAPVPLVRSKNNIIQVYTQKPHIIKCTQPKTMSILHDALCAGRSVWRGDTCKSQTKATFYILYISQHHRITAARLAVTATRELLRVCDFFMHKVMDPAPVVGGGGGGGGGESPTPASAVRRNPSIKKLLKLQMWGNSGTCFGWTFFFLLVLSGFVCVAHLLKIKLHKNKLCVVCILFSFTSRLNTIVSNMNIWTNAY